MSNNTNWPSEVPYAPQQGASTEQSLWEATESVLLRGVRYVIRRAGSGFPLLLLHGFTSSSATWELPFFQQEQDMVRGVLPRCQEAPRLSEAELSTIQGADKLRQLCSTRESWHLLAPDLLGHGQTDAPSDPARYEAGEQVADLLALLDYYGIAQIGVLGYSMGGRLALHLACAAPERCRFLILESASPGLADPEERAARRAADDELAQKIEERGLEWFVDYWERLPLFASQKRLPLSRRLRLRAERLAQRPVGLANSLRGFGAGAMPPVWEALTQLKLPVLVLVGALDARYVAIARQLTRHLPCAELCIVPEAGHAVHIENPSFFLAAVQHFLAAQAAEE